MQTKNKVSFHTHTHTHMVQIAYTDCKTTKIGFLFMRKEA